MDLRRTLAIEFAKAHPDRAAAVLESMGGEDAAAFLGSVPAPMAAAVLHRVTAHPAGASLARLPAEDAARIVSELPVEVASGYLRRTPADVRAAILAAVPARFARSLQVLLRFREGTAGALMDPHVLALPEDLSVREALDRVRKSAAHARYNIYVVDRDDRLVGVLNLRELLSGRPRARLSTLMKRDVIRLGADADRRAILHHPGWREVHSLPVVDADGRYLGAVRYRTLRRLESELVEPAAQGSVTSRALGDLFWTGVSGLIDAVAGAPTAGPADRRSDDGGE